MLRLILIDYRESINVIQYHLLKKVAQSSHPAKPQLER